MISKSQNVYYIFILLPVWALVLLVSPDSLFSQNSMIAPNALKVGPTALKKYVTNVVNKQNFSRFNFKSYEEAKIASLGDPYKVMYIGLDSLKRYESGSEIKSIMKDPKKIWFPVEVKGEIRTKMELLERKGSWIPGEFGGVRTVAEIASVKNQISNLIRSKGIKDPYTITLLEIPPIYAVFFYIDSQQGKYLVPAMIQPKRYDLENGRIYSADDVLARLKEFAVIIEGNKVM